MKLRLIAFVLLFLSLFPSVYAQKNLKGFFKRADMLFSLYVDSGRVDYLSLKNDPQIIKALVQEISELDLSRTSKKKAKAFYINAYNIFLIHNIITKYPLFSPLEEKGLFSERRNAINGERRTLNELEKIIFCKFKDIKLYAALSSGTEGCPSVADFAYRPGRLNRQLKKKFKIEINNPDFIRVKSKISLVLFCEAFKGYGNFFEKQDMIRYVNKFRSEELPLNFSLGFYPGKRSLNCKKN
jgi:hypothetical protein